MSWQIVHGDARALPLEDASVDLIVTSPPYWGLRSYRDGGEHYDGQVGSEITPQQYVDELVGMVDGEWRRVLKPSGSLFLNMGDKYANDAKWGGKSNAKQAASDAPEVGYRQRLVTGARPKSLLGLPWRVALNLIDRGWILRAEIIWSKPNGLPESVTDRVRRSHEQIFHFVLEPRYYSAVDEIREAYLASGTAGLTWGQRRSLGARGSNRGQSVEETDRWRGGAGDNTLASSPLGRLPGSVWTIPTSPLIIPDNAKQHFGLPDHFAAYPPELVRRIVLGWSPRGVCVRCGEGRRPVVEKAAAGKVRDDHGMGARHTGLSDEMDEGNRVACARSEWAEGVTRSVIGEACACSTPDADTTPGVVLDPMCGTGTTVGVAHKLGRHGIGVDLSEDYCRLAEWRVGMSGHFDGVEDRTMADRQLRLEG